MSALGPRSLSVTAIVQGRMSSERLPGKILEPLGSSTVLGWVVRSLRACGLVDRIVVATSTDPSDERTVQECHRLGVAVVRGPLDDVLTRFLIALDAYPSDLVVRVTADCPLLDPTVVDACVAPLLAVPSLEYVSNDLVASYPRGFDAECLRSETLRSLDQLSQGVHRTHVTSWITSHRQDYVTLGITLAPAHHELRVTIDTTEDLEVVRRIVDGLGDRVMAVNEVVEFLLDHPEVAAINADIRQKDWTEG